MAVRRENWSSTAVGVCLGAWVLASAPGCARRVRAEFPRPPVTASIPAIDANEPSSAPEEPAPIDVEETSETEAPEIPAEVEPAPPQAPAVSVAPSPPEQEPEPEPRSTQLSGSRPGDPELATKLDRAGSLLGSVSTRPLSDRQRSQIVAARGFVSQARRALDEGDERRALVLIDKGLILVEDVERASRP